MFVNHLDVGELREVHPDRVHFTRFGGQALGDLLEQLNPGRHLQQGAGILPRHLLEPAIGVAHVVHLVCQQGIHQRGGFVVTGRAPHVLLLPQQIHLPALEGAVLNGQPARACESSNWVTPHS